MEITNQRPFFFNVKCIYFKKIQNKTTSLSLLVYGLSLFSFTEVGWGSLPCSCSPGNKEDASQRQPETGESALGPKRWGRRAASSAPHLASWSPRRGRGLLKAPSTARRSPTPAGDPGLESKKAAPGYRCGGAGVLGALLGCCEP